MSSIKKACQSMKQAIATTCELACAPFTKKQRIENRRRFGKPLETRAIIIQMLLALSSLTILFSPKSMIAERTTELEDEDCCAPYYDEDFVERAEPYVERAIQIIFGIRILGCILYLKWPSVARYSFFLQGMLYSTYSLRPINYGAMRDYHTALALMFLPLI